MVSGSFGLHFVGGGPAGDGGQLEDHVQLVHLDMPLLEREGSLPARQAIVAQYFRGPLACLEL